MFTRLTSVLLFFLISVSAFGLDIMTDEVSFIQLAASPEKYKGRTIEIAGVLSIGESGRGYIFMSIEQYENLVIPNAIRVIVSEESREDIEEGQYVRITGEPVVDEKGNLLYFNNGRDIGPIL
ncbi:hypothetical protein ACJJIW_13395 [Microbulbifer sp. JMSA004]|uniref:hypothetical protein n=1 Tax=unclassified Microbulbifer TaxID=2619833 RepID=UPI00403B08F0